MCACVRECEVCVFVCVRVRVFVFVCVSVRFCEGFCVRTCEVCVLVRGVCVRLVCVCVIPRKCMCECNWVHFHVCRYMFVFNSFSDFTLYNTFFLLDSQYTTFY